MPSYKDTATGKWYCKFMYTDATGEHKQKKKRSFNLKREADEWERNFLAANRVPTCDMPFCDFVDVYIKDATPTIREHTIQQRRYQLKRFVTYWKDTPLSSISKADVITWINSLINENLSDTTIKNLVRTLSILFNHAIKYYKLKENPCRDVGRLKNPNREKPKMRYWTYEEFNKVIKEITDEKGHLALDVLYYTGMRKGELLALEWADMDFEAGSITISKSLQRLNGAKETITPTKTGETRTIRIPRFLTDELLKFKESSTSERVFEWEKRFIEKAIEQGASAAGVKRIHVHGLRHSHASYLISKGVNIVLISKRLGHSKTSITLDTYSHFFPKDEEDLISSIEKDNIKK